MSKEKSKILAVRVLYGFIAIESITVFLLFLLILVDNGNRIIMFVLSAVLTLFAAAIVLVNQKKYNAAKFIVITVPPYAVLLLSIIEKYYGIFNNTYSYLNPQLFEIIYLMVPVILFGLVYPKKMAISLLIILPAAVLFSWIHKIFGIDTDALIADRRFYSLFIIIFSVFYSVSVVSVLFFQKTSILYKERIKRQMREALKEKEKTEAVNEELAETKKRFELAQKAGNIGVWEWNVKENKILWTETTYQIFGVEKKTETVKINDFFKILYPEDVARIQEELEYALEKGVSNLRTKYRIIKNGKIRYIEEMSEIVRSDDGEFVKMTGVVTDITDRIIAEKEIREKNEELTATEEELRQSNEELQSVKEEIEAQYNLLRETNKKYNLLANNIIDFIWMLSTELKPLYISNSCEKFLGYTSEELKSISLRKIHTKKSYDLIKKIILASVRKNKTITNSDISKIEVEYIHKNGNIIIAEVIGSLIYEDGKIIGIGGVSRDITDRKKAEAALAASNEKLKEVYKDLLDNMRYAKKIQDALLTPQKTIDNAFDDYFLLFKPRDMISGDFYYINRLNKFIVFAVGDCTGHGVSGGFLTMIAITYLHEIVRTGVVNNPAQALEILRRRFKRTYKAFGKDSHYGFNIALCAINTETNILQYSGAYHPLFIARNKKLIEYKETRSPIGFHFKESDFIYHKIQLEDDDKIYIFSDGYYDQINCEGKKIGKKQFKTLLSEINHLPTEKQEKILLSYLYNWKQNQSQVDDITVLGIKYQF